MEQSRRVVTEIIKQNLRISVEVRFGLKNKHIISCLGTFNQVDKDVGRTGAEAEVLTRDKDQ
jgi:hypothetical protein